jgi:hypothetical protein
MGDGIKAALLCALLGGCVSAPVSGDAGCRTYGFQRASMPTLGADAVSEWVAVMDSAMTGACRP